MEQQRQVLLVACAFLLTLHVVTDVEARASGGQDTTAEKVNLTRWFSYINNTVLYRQDNLSSPVSSLVGLPASCLWMQWKSGWGEVPNATVFLTYNKTMVDIVNVTQKQSTSDIIVFTFNETSLPELENRKVEYQLLSTNYTSCSILNTSTPYNCSYLVFYTTPNETVPEWCRPKDVGNCTLEVHTPDEPSECKEKEIEDVTYGGFEEESEK